MADQPIPEHSTASLAFHLGWRLAELYDSDDLGAHPTAGAGAALPDHLPGAGEMSPYERSMARAANAKADLATLGTALGGQWPDLSSVVATLAKPDHSRQDAQRTIWEAYLAIRDQLAGTDAAASVSFGLGRMLADTAFLPGPDQPEELGRVFEHFRLANVYQWLDDLDAAFPQSAASAVGASIRAWESWVAGLRSQDGSLSADAITPNVIRLLHRQGELWRRLLAGQKAPADLLDSNDYVSAAGALMARGTEIAGHFLKRWWLAVLLTVVVTGALVWVAITYAPPGTDRLAAVLVSIAGFLGVSWTGIRATLGKALERAEAQLWNAEVIASIGRAATLLPSTSGTKVDAL